jgi:hypothetical protein
VNRAILVVLPLTVVLSLWACSSSTPTPSQAATPPLTPTPGILSRLDPNVVEETETYVIHRLPKKNYIRVDDRHIRNPVVSSPIEFFKEDENYYYISTPRWTPEELALKQATTGSGLAAAPPPTPRPLAPGTRPKPSLAEFEDVSPPRTATRLKLQKVPHSGLPDAGMWRASFELADVNQDGKIDVVSPAPRVGDSNLHIWLGDGRGSFSELPLTFTEDGAPATNFSVGYGGVAVGDIDGDGKLDVVVASHNAGLQSLFGNGNGEFRVLQKGLPGKDFSSQAIALLDVDGDRKLDIVASRDIMIQDSTTPGPSVRVYLYRGSSWLKEDALVRGVISNSLHAWDFDGDGKKDVLTGSHQFAAIPVLWKNEGNGSFSPVKFDDFEVWAFHFATTPGTFGAGRVPAFADSFHLYTDEPKVSRAIGINVYSFESGAWTRHRVWRHKEGKSAQYALAMGDLDGDGLDDIAFADTGERRLRVFFQRPDQSFEEMAVKDEPALDSHGQCIRFGDVDGDGRVDVVVAKTVSSTTPEDRGGWDVYLNKR